MGWQMIIEKFGTLSVIVGSKALGIVAFVSSGMALSMAGRAATAAAVALVPGAARPGPVVTVPRRRLDSAGQWSRLTRGTGGTAAIAARARDLHEKAGAGLAATSVELEKLHRELAAIGPASSRT
ncbi:MAG: hypothetical protein SFW09_16210 [Hyphomicrobiaceae bacterium]|nr:hypothetical protein [Hyphomicrobiaceae bacterium]